MQQSTITTTKPKYILTAPELVDGVYVHGGARVAGGIVRNDGPEVGMVRAREEAQTWMYKEHHLINATIEHALSFSYDRRRRSLGIVI